MIIYYKEFFASNALDFKRWLLVFLISTTFTKRTESSCVDKQEVEELKLNLKELENKFSNFQAIVETQFEKLKSENKMLKETIVKNLMRPDTLPEMFLEENQKRIESSSEELQPHFKTVQPSITITADNLYVCQQKLDELEQLSLQAVRELKIQKLKMENLNDQYQGVISTYNNSINGFDDLKKTVGEVINNLHDERLRIDIINRTQRGQITHINNNYYQIEELKDKLNSDVHKTLTLEEGQQNNTRLLKQQTSQLELLTNNFNGLSEAVLKSVFIWKINNFTMHLQNAKTAKKRILESEPFFTGTYGYKMGISVYPNGDYPSNGTHLSLYFQLMKGEMDDILTWPFTYKITMAILDQGPDEKKLHRQLSLKPGPDFPDFQKPRNERNNKRGFPGMISHTDLLESNRYLQNDCIFIRVVIHL